MNLKKITIISIISIFLLSMISHNLYVWFPSKIISYFFPVNESIFEHLKMVNTTIMFYGIIEYFLLKKVKHNNFILGLVSGNVATILSVLLLFTPVYYLMNMKDNIIITLIIYFISIIIGQIVTYFIFKSNKNYERLNIISLFLIPIIFIMFIYFTYNPIKTGIFYDYNKKIYGINIK